VVGIALTDSKTTLAKYAAKERFPFTLYSKVSDAEGKALNLRSTPSTIWVGSDRRVRQIWEGAYGGKTKKAIEQALGVTLPTLDLTPR
jgi:serine protease inhibitor